MTASKIRLFARSLSIGITAILSATVSEITPELVAGIIAVVEAVLQLFVKDAAPAADGEDV